LRAPRLPRAPERGPRPRPPRVPALRDARPRARAGRRQPHDVLVPRVSELGGSGPRSEPLRRVGHKGADLIAPGNTFASFDAALDAGVHMIEFDVLPEHHDGRGELWLAHDYEAAKKVDPRPPTLDEGLAHLNGETFADVH